MEPETLKRQSVDPGQLTAARAVGMTKLQGIRHVVLPQGLRFAIPGWTNEFVYLFRRARDIGADTFQFTDIYVIVAAFYLVLTTAMAMGRVESWVAIPGLGSGGRG